MLATRDDFLVRTIEIWQPLSKTPLSLDDAREIAENTVGFYGTLIRWAREANATNTLGREGGGHGCGPTVP